MTQRRDSVFENIVNNEPGNMGERPIETRRHIRKDARMERLQMIALILMNLSEVADAREELLANEGSEHGFA